ncbi:hypothetical protein BY458DRAFT_509816 [Sporodiniella umbellata]|nr:hypothetical protein BY458DRAFT_509816 [Sporodiniella umbellata]
MLDLLDIFDNSSLRQVHQLKNADGRFSVQKHRFTCNWLLQCFMVIGDDISS